MQSKKREFPVIFAPQIVDGVIPFIQFRFIRNSLSNPLMKSVTIDKFEKIKLVLQEFKVQVDQDIVRVFLGVLRNLLDSLASYDLIRSKSTATVSVQETDKSLNPTNLALSFNPNQKTGNVFIKKLCFESMKIVLSFRTSKKKPLK